MAMMQGSNKPKNEGKPAGGPPLDAMTAETVSYTHLTLPTKA